MKSLLLIALSLTTLLFAACEATPEKKTEVVEEDSTARVLASDMYLNCWFNEHTLQKAVYHSAPFSSKIDSTWPDSYGMRAYVKDLSGDLPQYVKVDFWTLFPETGINGKLVVSVDSLDKNRSWQGVDLKDSITTANKWQHIRCSLPLPKRINLEDKVTIYVWSADKKLMYVDDLTVKFLYR